MTVSNRLSVAWTVCIRGSVVSPDLKPENLLLDDGLDVKILLLVMWSGSSWSEWCWWWRDTNSLISPRRRFPKKLSRFLCILPCSFCVWIYVFRFVKFCARRCFLACRLVRAFVDSCANFLFIVPSLLFCIFMNMPVDSAHVLFPFLRLCSSHFLSILVVVLIVFQLWIAQLRSSRSELIFSFCSFLAFTLPPWFVVFSVIFRKDLADFSLLFVSLPFLPWLVASSLVLLSCFWLFLLSLIFGFRFVAVPGCMYRFVYSGPEIDVWSCGIQLFFICYVAHFPFDDENIQTAISQNKRETHIYSLSLFPSLQAAGTF